MRKVRISILSIGICIFTLGVLYTIGVFYTIRKSQQDQHNKAIQNSKILNSASIKPTDITIDYSNQISTGSPLIFGGSHAPEPSQQDAWNKIAEIGMTSIRKDFFIENLFPETVTLDDYKKNINNIQNPKNWDQDVLNEVGGMYENAKARNMKTIGIAGYAPAWLTYTGTPFGVPKDWNVYEDIVRKTYAIYRKNLDYVEIWNEPNYKVFLDPTGSGLSADEAYVQIFFHTAKAIREVDNQANDGKIMPLGGPVGYDPTHTSTLEALLQNNSLKNTLSFVSYHNYENKHLKEPSWIYYKQVLASYGKGSLPIFITEWNFDPDSGTPNEYNTSNLAIPFTANKFVSFLKMGLAGANYHVIEQLDNTKPNGGEGYMGFYKWVNNSAQLLPQARSWRLLSKDMGLGKGPSKIYTPSENITDMGIIGFANSLGRQGFVVVNMTHAAQIANFHLKNVQKSDFLQTTLFTASPQDDASRPSASYILPENKNQSSLDYLVNIPEESAVGLVFTPSHGIMSLSPFQ